MSIMTQIDSKFTKDAHFKSFNRYTYHTTVHCDNFSYALNFCFISSLKFYASVVITAYDRSYHRSYTYRLFTTPSNSNLTKKEQEELFEQKLKLINALSNKLPEFLKNNFSTKFFTEDNVRDFAKKLGFDVDRIEE